MGRCIYCAGLTIQRLVELAQNEATRWTIPRTCVYKHQPSVNHLEASALAGCDLCFLIVDCLKRTVSKSLRHRDTWQDEPSPDATALFTTAQELDNSHVKLWIDFSHWIHDDSELPETAHVLDIINVHLGPQWVYQPSDSGEEADEIDTRSDFSTTPDQYAEMARLRLTLSTEKGHDVHVDGFRIGRTEQDSEIGSASNHAMAKDWFRECEQNHAECWPETETSRLPTRVLDVGNGPDDELRLFCSEGSRAQYAALSHCWGGRVDPLLLGDNLAQFRDSVPYSSLAANFRDTITITRNLGIRYLWIDSLCIIQDSKRDWEQESMKMGAIYRDAAVTIIASASKGSKQGILNKRPVPPGPKRVTLKVLPDSDATVTVTRFEPHLDENLWTLSWQSPLAKRGWTLQEASLSTRCLVYGTQGVYWQCPREFRTADGLIAGINLFPDKPTELETIIRSPSLLKHPGAAFNQWKLFNEYYTIVCSYAERSLTVASDKLPAMSAIAAAMSEALAERGAPSKYLAGLWETDLLWGMTWYREMDEASHVSPYRAPSWSWAVTDSPILFDGKEDDRSAWGTSPQDMKVLSHQVRLKNPDNPFGEVEAGRLVVDCLALPLIRSLQTVKHETPGWENIGYCQYDDLPSEDRRFEGDLGVEWIRRFTKDGETYLLAYYLHSGRYTKEDGNGSIDEEAYYDVEQKVIILHVMYSYPHGMTVGHGLAVRRRPDSEYERVGYVMVMGMKPEWFDTWPREELTLV